MKRTKPMFPLPRTHIILWLYAKPALVPDASVSPPILEVLVSPRGHQTFQVIKLNQIIFAVIFFVK